LQRAPSHPTPTVTYRSHRGNRRAGWYTVPLSGEPNRPDAGDAVLGMGHSYACRALRSRLTLGRGGFLGMASCAKPATRAVARAGLAVEDHPRLTRPARPARLRDDAGEAHTGPARDHHAISGLEARVLWRHSIEMPSGAVTLADYPGDVIVLACEKCERRGRYSKARLVAEHGPNIKLPDLRHRLAAGCPRVKNPTGNVGCGAIYPDLAPAS
jgi:hypothetical protein